MTESVIALPDDIVQQSPVRHASPTRELNDMASLYIETSGRIAELNTRAIRASIDEQHAVALEASNEYSPFEVWRLQTGFALAGTAKAAAYWRHLSDIAWGAFADAVGQTERHVNSAFMALNRSLEETTTGVASSVMTGDPSAAPESARNATQRIRTDLLSNKPRGATS